MAKKKSRKGFKIPDPKKQLSNVVQAISKYRVGEKGVFHIVWYDRNHIIYPKK